MIVFASPGHIDGALFGKRTNYLFRHRAEGLGEAFGRIGGVAESTDEIQLPLGHLGTI